MFGTMPSVRAPRWARWLALTTLAAAGLVAITSCERRRGCAGEYCGTLVFAAPGEPDILLPAVTQQQYAQDIAGQLFLKLADLGLSENTVGDEDFQPQLAERWEWDDPLTLVFHLDPRAHWQDGRPVTAADVAFTFDIYSDSLVNSPFRSSLRTISAVTTRDALTAVFRFHARYPEMFYDAVYHMRILPAHLLRPVPRSQWRSTAFGRAPVGDGPYRFVAWKAGASVELKADSTFFLGRPHIRRLIWRFTPNLQVAVTQVIAGDADAVEVLGPPDNVKRAQAAPNLALYPYRGELYGFLAFNLSTNGDTTKPHLLFGDRQLRRALTMAVDREGLRKSVWGDLAQVPPGPLARLWTIWDPETRQLPYDTTQAARMLTWLGWRDSNGDGIRDRDGQPLAFRILAPRRRQGTVAARHRNPEPGRAGGLPVRAGQYGGGESPGDGRRDPAGRLLGAGAYLAHPRRPADRSRPRGALGDGVARAASRRRDRHRLCGRHDHLRAHPPRAGDAVRRGRAAPAGSGGDRAAGPPVRPRSAVAGPVRAVSPQPPAWRAGTIVFPASAGRRRHRGYHPAHAHPRGRGARRRLWTRARARRIPGRAGAALRRRRARQRRAVLPFAADVLAGARLAARLRPVAARLSGRGHARPGVVPERHERALLRGCPVAPRAAGADARASRCGRDGALPAGRDARGRGPGLRPDRARQGPPGASRPAGACAPQRAALVHHADRPRLPVPADRRRARRNGVRLAGHGSPVGRGDLSARLPARYRSRAR